MEEPETIVNALDRFFDEQQYADNPLHGKRILITAGPTYEKIDPVRFIGNYSSGKMGFAIAEECRKRGAVVTLVAGPVALSCSNGIKRIDVESCKEMYDATTKAFADSDIAILAAAVADFKPQKEASQKIKRGESDMTIKLCPTQDIAEALGKQKRNDQTIVAFALETNDEELNAKKKLEKKNADFIVLNSLRNEGTCFQTDNNQIEIISAKGKLSFQKKSKKEVAGDIVDALAETVAGKKP